MSTLTASRTVTINLEAACHDHACAQLAARFRNQLGVPNYSQGASVLEMPESLQAWRDEHRTARKRADRAARLGYQFDEINRASHNDDIHRINTSLPERQGRPMTDGYTTRRNHGNLPAYPCDRHRIHTYGILQGERLRAYLTLYRCGELGLVSMILGHGDHLRNDIMYLLMAGVIADQVHHGGVLYYNRHDSGTPGLAFYKERIGFHATDIEWLL
jgi:hypothetical protein